MGALQRRRLLIEPITLEYAPDVVVHFDAIDNTGGSGHDATYLNWRDLASGYEFIQNSVNGGSLIPFEDYYFKFNGANYFTKTGLSSHPWSTMEVVLEGASLEQCVFASTGNANGLIHTRNGRVIFGTNHAVLAQDGLHTYAWNGTTTFIDGTQSVSSASNSWSVFRNWIIGGGSNYYSGTTYKYTGKVCSIRLYDRALSSEEIAQNALVDRSRFGIGG